MFLHRDGTSDDLNHNLNHTALQLHDVVQRAPTSLSPAADHFKIWRSQDFVPGGVRQRFGQGGGIGLSKSHIRVFFSWCLISTNLLPNQSLLEFLESNNPHGFLPNQSCKTVLSTIMPFHQQHGQEARLNHCIWFTEPLLLWLVCSKSAGLSMFCIYAPHLNTKGSSGSMLRCMLLSLCQQAFFRLHTIWSV